MGSVATGKGQHNGHCQKIPLMVSIAISGEKCEARRVIIRWSKWSQGVSYHIRRPQLISTRNVTNACLQTTPTKPLVTERAKQVNINCCLSSGRYLLVAVFEKSID